MKRNTSFLSKLKPCEDFMNFHITAFLGIQRKRDAEMVNLNFEICEKTEAINLLREELDLLQDQKSTEYLTLIEERAGQILSYFKLKFST